jgi:hypothetical protein
MIQVRAPNGEIAQFPDGMPDDQIASIMQQTYGGPKGGDPVGAVEDVAKSAGVGLGRGAIGVAGAVGDISDLGAKGLQVATDFISKKLGLGKGQGLPEEVRASLRSALDNIPTSAGITKAVEENVTGKFYQPQTRAGEYAKTAAEFIPGALMGPGGAVRNAAVFGAVPGVASEFAGGLVKGSDAEPYARAGAALATGALGGLATAPGNVAGTVGRAAGGLDRATLQQAEALFQEAQAMGIPITRAEAIQAVTNGGTNFGNLQRVVEGQGGLADFMARRAAGNDAAAGRVFDQVTPAAPNPSAIGPAVGTAAEGVVNDARGIVNAASDPFYAQAAGIRLTPYEFQQARALPGYADAAAQIRNTPQLARYVQGLPEDSVGFLNEVKKLLGAASDNAAAPVNQQRNMQISAGYGLDADAARGIGVNASRRTPGNPYETALNIQETGRAQIKERILDGPIGKIADKDTTTKKAIDVLFPNNPLPNSADEIATAVSAVSRRNPYAARNLVRTHLEMTFNEATQNLASGPNSFGGAKFAAVVRGNPQQAANLEAAISSLPNGDRIYQGVDRFLTILEAQGQRQAIGSKTAFNTEALQDLRQGKAISEVGSAVASAGMKLPTKIKERIERWRLGNNVDELARLFTDPQAGREFIRLANTNHGGQTTASLVRLVGLVRQPYSTQQSNGSKK